MPVRSLGERTKKHKARAGSGVASLPARREKEKTRMTDLNFDCPRKGRIARRRAFYLHPDLEAEVEAHPIAVRCTSGHGRWHTLLVGTLLRALLAGDVCGLERHLEAALDGSRRSHSMAQAKGQATLLADPSRRKRRNTKKV